MNEIVETYKKLVGKYQKIDKDLTENEIHDKRVILRKVFPILTAFKINPRKIKNGDKAFELFGKLRDVQVQILKLETMDSIPEITKYILFLKESEQIQKENLRKFIKKKKLQFPVIKKKSGIDQAKIISKAEKSLSKIEKMIKLWSVEDTEYVHQIRIEFKKFRYQVEVLSITTPIVEEKLEKIGLYQDKLGEIHDFEVLIDGITKFYKKRKEKVSTDVFKEAQNKLIDEFEIEMESFIQACVDVISFNTDIDMLNEDKETLDNAVESMPVTIEEIVHEEIIPEVILPEEIIPEEIVPEEIVPEEIVPEETVPEETVPEETVPEDIVEPILVNAVDVQPKKTKVLSPKKPGKVVTETDE